MLEDLIKIIHSSSSSLYYRQIGEGLGVDIKDLSSYRMSPMNKLILVFQKWIHSANNVTWGKILKVCNDNPSILLNASAKLIEFLKSEEEQSNTMFDSITDKELFEKLGKEALQEDFIKIFHSSSQDYAAIGVGLGVDVEDLMTDIDYARLPSVNKLILIFKRLRDYNNDRTWGKILKVCKDYPKELSNAEAKLIRFLKSDKEQSNTMIPSITDEELSLLKEEPLQEHFIKIFHSSCRVSDHYALIGVGLGVEVNDLIKEYSGLSSLYKLILVFQRWMDSYNNVTWEKILKVCEDYPKELRNVKDELIQFLKEEQINSMTDNELLKKNPSHRDLLKIFHSSSQVSDHYAVIGVGLGVDVSFLILGPHARLKLVNKLILVFELWISSDKNVTWGKILKVCGDYKELGRAEDKLNKFLLSKEEQSISINSKINEKLLKKGPLQGDLMKIFSIASDHYAIIGVGLDIRVADLMQLSNMTDDLLWHVFHKWISSDKNVTWEKILKVCDDYPELGRAKDKLEKFLLSEEAQKYLQRELNMKISDASAFDEGHQMVDQEDVERSHTIVIATLAVIISFLYMYNLRQNN